MESAPGPIIVAIDGFCFTDGLELAPACDVRIAGEGATFTIASSRLGTVPGFDATQRLPWHEDRCCGKPGFEGRRFSRRTATVDLSLSLIGIML